MPIVVSTQPLPPTPDEPVEPKFRDEPTLIWNGWTGDAWTLALDKSARAFIEEDGLSGILKPPVQHYLSEPATRAGSTWQGHRVLAREVVLPLFVWGDTPSQMRAEDTRFRRTLRPEQTGVLVVADPDGTRRELTLRYLSGAEGRYGADTYGKTWCRHQVTLLAEDPYFYGDPVTVTFGGTAGGNFYGGVTGVAPLFVISTNQTIAGAALNNPGDEDAWLTWKIYGPMTSFVGGWGGNLINLPITLTAGQWLEVNSDPQQATIVNQAGVNQWGAAGDVRFAPLPALATTSLSMTIVGSTAATKVEVTFRPKHEAAW